MCDPVSLTIAAVGAATTGASVIQGNRQMRAQRSAAAQAKADADRVFAENQRETNRANQKRPDVSAILAGARRSGASGQSGTLLTGSGGVPSDAFTLGRVSLLGT